MLPPTIPIFPLPNVVLFPNVFLPLHIFETRYRQMVDDALRGDRIIGMVLLRPGWQGNYEGRPPIYPVGCAGVITHAERLADGRFNIVLRGVQRAVIEEELPSGEPYRLVRARELSATPKDLPRVAALGEGLKRLVLALSAARPGPEMQALVQLAARAQDPGDLADIVSGALLSSPRERQAALETVDYLPRLELATQAAASELARTASTAEAPN